MLSIPFCKLIILDMVCATRLETASKERYMPISTPTGPAARLVATSQGESDWLNARKARFWDRSASKYAASRIADLPGYEQSVARTINYLGPSYDVLEVGCGTGSSALRLATYCSSYRATDVSTEMISIARKKLAASPNARLQFSVADAEASPAEVGKQYDRVLAFNVLHLADDVDDMIAGCAAALRPGGLLISKTPCLREMNWLIPNVAVPLARLFGKAPTVRNLGERDLLDAMQRHGLTIVNVERHGTRGRDVRPYIVARKPAAVSGM
jgi:2-polyprenyl-3-methyl-5-hydroxy-6-metoxy-1,4-benzoquinol methylase